jgi:hypothetical protein
MIQHLQRQPRVVFFHLNLFYNPPLIAALR